MHWIPAFAGMTERLSRIVIPDLIGNPEKLRLCRLIEGLNTMIEHVDIINLSHYDLGFTDHPEVCARLQKEYIGRALTLCLANEKKNDTERFYWTIESNAALADWWGDAGRKLRRQFIRAVEAGWIEVCAMPFNKSSILNARQWRYMARWLPDDLWESVKPRVIMQNDVNGMPRAGVMALMDRGAEFVWMSINLDTGGSPLPQPSAFWWRMPDGRKIFVWNSIPYPGGYSLFEAKEWRKGPVPKAADTRYREPASGDFFEVSDNNLKAACSQCEAKLAQWLGPDCLRKRVAVPMTNMWRMDNDPPCALLPRFIAAWNKAGLRPKLAMTTPAPALEALRAEWGANAPVMEGEWTDWWVNGTASLPREMAAARKAKRLVAALESPLFKTKASENTVRDCLRDLCLFDEHTFGSWDSESDPWNHDSRGHYAAKAILAYRPLALAEWMIGKSVRRHSGKMEKGALKVINPYDKPFTGWVTLTEDCLRGCYNGMLEKGSETYLPLVKKAGWAPFRAPAGMDEISADNVARVFSDRKKDKAVELWISNLAGGSEKTYKLTADAGTSRDARARLGGAFRLRGSAKSRYGATTAGEAWAEPAIEKNKSGWPIGLQWNDEEKLTGNWGDFYSLEFGGDFPRWTYKQVWANKTENERRQARDRMAKCIKSEPGITECRDKGPTIVFWQEMTHPRLRFLRKELEIFKGMPRARLKITLYRLARPESAEIFYLRIPLGMADAWPVITNGGQAFAPGKDQLPKTCRDYYAFDGDVIYRQGKRQVTLSCRDNALASFGGMRDGLGVESLTGDLSDIYVILFNNIWYTNFAGDESGTFQFEFDIYRSKNGFTGFAPEVFPILWP